MPGRRLGQSIRVISPDVWEPLPGCPLPLARLRAALSPAGEQQAGWEGRVRGGACRGCGVPAGGVGCVACVGRVSGVGRRAAEGHGAAGAARTKSLLYALMRGVIYFCPQLVCR